MVLITDLVIKFFLLFARAMFVLAVPSNHPEMITGSKL